MMKTETKPEAIAELIRASENIAVCTHVYPDGDTIGAALAMKLGMESLGKTVRVYCRDKVPDQLSFLPGADEIISVSEGALPAYDLLLAVDISDESRMGDCIRLKETSTHFAQIDHHPTNPLYAQVNSVDGNAAATSVLILEQLKVLGVPLTEQIAECLYTGISTDTGNFSYQCTDADAFRAMSELAQTGFSLQDLSRRLFRERSREQLLLLGKAINSLKFYGEGQLAVMRLTLADFEACGALSEHADTLVNYGLETTGTKMALLTRESPDGRIKCSLRAVPPLCVNDIAKAFGGGGHPQAAGISMSGTLDEVTERVAMAMVKEK